jgi:hypothetical protein
MSMHEPRPSQSGRRKTGTNYKVFLLLVPYRIVWGGGMRKFRKPSNICCPLYRVPEHGCVPADAALLCDTAAVLGDTLQGTRCTLLAILVIYIAQ